MIRPNRREAIAALGAGLAVPASAADPLVHLPFANGGRPLVRYPQKRPLIRLTARPPQLETPFAVFDEGVITPNDAFFVRYHLPNLPEQVDPATFRLAIGGHVERPLSLSLAELRRDFPRAEVIAVNQCSGNSRGFSDPRVAGGQLGNGAMGNALWQGVPLKALLDRAGVRAGARQVAFDGMDRPALPSVPDFVKALPIDHARDGDVLVAWGMNGAALPILNGFPLRLIVPGHYGTYWVKHLDRIDVLDADYDGYWMKTAYRVPDNDCACVAPGEKPAATRPIGRLNVRAFATSHADGVTVRPGRTRLGGIAFDGGSGIAAVDVSVDGGATWRPATLERDHGRYSFRRWHFDADLAAGSRDILTRATASNGDRQPLEPRWQPAGYMRNVVERLRLEVA